MAGGQKDSDLVREAASGSVSAREMLYRQYWPLAWRVAFAVTGSRAAADDAAQNAFLRAFGSLSSFDATRELAPWLRKITVRCALDQRGVEPGSELDSREDSTWGGIVDSDEPELLDAVRRLPHAQRLTIVLRFWLGYTTGEIAELLGEPPGTVYARLSRTLQLLREEMEDSRA